VADGAGTTISENAAARSPVVWIDGSAAGHSLEGPGDSGFDLSASGLTGGVELHGDLGGGAVTLGISGGYAKARIDAAHARADADIARLGAYVDWAQGPVSVSGALSYGRASIDTFRDLAGVATALSESDASLFAGSLEATYNLAEYMGLTDNVVVAPLATLDFAGIHRDGFVETGAGGLGLTVGKERAARALAGLGIRLGARHDIGGGWSVMPVVDLAYQRGFGDDEVTTALALPRFDADFTEVSAAVPRDRFAVGASLTITQGEHLSFSAGYRGAFGSGLSSHTGSVGLSYRF
jgi:outer membrane autotransporter protein